MHWSLPRSVSTEEKATALVVDVRFQDEFRTWRVGRPGIVVRSAAKGGIRNANVICRV